MSRCLSNYYRDQHRQKRTATVISIHVPRYDNGLPLEETMVRLRGSGYSDRDIARKHNVSMDQVRKLLNEVRLTLKALCYE